MAQRTATTHRGGASTGFGIILVVLGVLLLDQQVFHLGLWPTSWPFGIVAIGVAFFAGMVLGGKSMSALAIPGSVITTVGLILAYQDRFDRYETWSYAWALIVVAVGIGLLIKGFWTDDPAAFQGGLRTAGIGAALFVVFGAFFELVIGFSGIETGMIQRWFWPAMLIAFGVVLLLKSRSNRQPR